MTTGSNTALAVLLAPIVGATAILLAIAAAERSGRTPFSDGPPQNPAEAAAMGNAADLMRMLGDGASAARVYRVRPHIISRELRNLTTVEAAMWARQIRMIELLDARGAIPGPARPGLACLARDLRLDDIAAYLDAATECTPGAALRRLQMRRSAESATHD
jgi:hypothetical protein